MKVERDISRRIAETANIVNSINGGTVFPTFKKTTEKDHYRLEVSAPTIKPNDLKVEVNGTDLMVYQNVHESAFTLPNILGLITISADVELENISAEFEDDLLVVIMPFNEFSGGFQKEIDIYKP
ncbi:Hsp20/alpha crystallin family protein [Ekhidna sp.]|uniref:Hsp20/alpha crystallin family protein n=1 Tax=Ekhidna sp. TaxID=2608089 RepID=UPI003298F701